MEWMIHFCMPRVKTTTKICEETVLESVVKSLDDTLFIGNAGSSNKIQHQLTSQNVVKNASQTTFPH